MGYFNYFIKCIIRNIAYRLCKPKILCTVLLVVAILFALHSTGYCTEWAQSEIDLVLNDLTSITNSLDTQVSYLASININVSDIENELEFIKSSINDINDDTTNISDRMSTLITKINTLNTNIINIYNKLEENQQELITELQTENSKILEELNMIRDALNSSDEELTSFTDLGVINSTNSNYKFRGISLKYDSGYSYKIKLYCRSESFAKAVRVYYSDNIIPSGFNYEDYTSKVIGLDIIPANYSTYIINYDVPSSKPIYIYFGWNVNISQIEVYRSIKGISDSLSQNNTLQQEGNQLQQEQNDFLKDDNVETDGFEFATNDTNNPTEEGFNTLFTSIYNAFCNTSSAPLTITLPYVNETFTIQPNLVSNAMQKMRTRSCGNVNSVFLLLWCLSIYI